MNADVIITKDEITEDLSRRIKAFKSPRKILQAMGATLASITVAAFKEPKLRPTPWKNTKNGAATLYDKGALFESIGVVSTSDTSVTVGTDRPYAAVHQLGAKPYVITPNKMKGLFWPGAKHPVKKVNHPGFPPRPFFPFYADGRITEEASRRIESTIRGELDG
jgi:phage gpG-like protein